jgi:hypothetical protein
MFRDENINSPLEEELSLTMGGDSKKASSFSTSFSTSFSISFFDFVLAAKREARSSARGLEEREKVFSCFKRRFLKFFLCFSN